MSAVPLAATVLATEPAGPVAVLPVPLAEPPVGASLLPGVSLVPRAPRLLLAAWSFSTHTVS